MEQPESVANEEDSEQRTNSRDAVLNSQALDTTRIGGNSSMFKFGS
jgi:hypothetical protein